MYLLKQYLRNGGTLADLKNNFAIDATRHKTYDNLVLLKYDQINSPFDNPLVCEARGIILDEADNWRVVCARFNKFFNYGQGHAAQIDWNTARITEKCDGSLCTLYFYDNSWHCATSGSPDASGRVNGWNFTFAELFWKIFNEMGLNPPIGNINLCPSFELLSPYNRVVVPHKECKLVFIGLHDRLTGLEYPLDTLPNYPAVRSFSFNSLDETLEAVQKLDGLNNEGFVVVDEKYDRIKIKSEQYVKLHHLRSSISPRNILEVVRLGEIEELEVYLSEYKEQINEIKNKFNNLVNHMSNVYEQNKHIADQKEFALAIKECPMSSALFCLRAQKTKSIKDFLAKIHIDYLARALNIKTEV